MKMKQLASIFVAVAALPSAASASASSSSLPNNIRGSSDNNRMLEQWGNDGYHSNTDTGTSYHDGDNHTSSTAYSSGE